MRGPGWLNPDQLASSKAAMLTHYTSHAFAWTKASTHDQSVIGLRSKRNPESNQRPKISIEAATVPALPTELYADGIVYRQSWPSG